MSEPLPSPLLGDESPRGLPWVPWTGEGPEPHGGLYALSLDDGEVRYVGITVYAVTDRVTVHLRNAVLRDGDLPVHRWVRRHGWRAVRYTVLARPDDVRDLPALEVAEIARRRAAGERLLNATSGGEGTSGYTRVFSEAHREALRRGSAAMSPEVRAEANARRTAWNLSRWAVAGAGERHGDLLREWWTEDRRAERSELTRKRMASLSDEERATRSRSSRAAMHRRWHVNRGLVKDGCEFCEERPR